MLVSCLAFLSLFVVLLGAEKTQFPCCYYPCQNGGQCLDDLKSKTGYVCDCTNTGFTGDTCESRGWNIAGRLEDMLVPSVPTLVYITRRFNFLWDILNAIKPLWRVVVGVVLQQQIDSIDTIAPGGFAHPFRYIDSAFNMSVYSSTLPPVPPQCPTPTGAYGPVEGKQPDPNEIFDVIFLRKKFVPNKIRSNVLFTYFAQHFTHQLFQTVHGAEPGLIWSPTHQIDMNQVYGHTPDIQSMLRSGKDGKFKMQKINGEEWPLYMKEFPGWNETFGKSTMAMSKYQPFKSEEDIFALAHPLYAPNPGLVAFSTMWMREHNRICDVLRKAHPSWTDDNLFQTTRLLIIALNARVVLTDYVQHLSGFNIRLDFVPQLIHAPYGTNRVRLEYNYLYHWHALIPETWYINGSDISHNDFFGAAGMLPKLGLGQFFSDAANQPAGEISRYNFPKEIRPVVTAPIIESRKLRIQSLNNHRRRFKLKPWESFIELTGGDKELAKTLEKWYGHVEAVELIPGYFAEKTLDKGLTPETVTVIGAAYAVFGLFTLPIAAPNWWKPSTFGGEVGWEIFQTTDTIQQIICRNIPGPCPTNIGMKYPVGAEKKYEL